MFLGTFVDLFSVQGAIGFGVTLGCMKALHELGHAYTAKRFGCRVPTMGLALLVMVPVLYTDVNDVVEAAVAAAAAGDRAGRRHHRASLCRAGAVRLDAAAERSRAQRRVPGRDLDLADHGAAQLPARSCATTAITCCRTGSKCRTCTRRAFALAQWWLRETLLGLGDPVPEEMPARRRNLLVAFAFLTWIYRFTLFLGIAVIVYHFAIKILGHRHDDRRGRLLRRRAGGARTA